MQTIKYAILTFVQWQFSSIKYILAIVQPSPPPIPRMLSFPAESLLPLDTTSCPAPQPLETTFLLFSLSLTAPGTSCEQAHVASVLWGLAYFMELDVILSFLLKTEEYCVDEPHCVYPSSVDGHGCLLPMVSLLF